MQNDGNKERKNGNLYRRFSCVTLKTPFEVTAKPIATLVLDEIMTFKGFDSGSTLKMLWFSTENLVLGWNFRATSFENSKNN